MVFLSSSCLPTGCLLWQVHENCQRYSNSKDGDLQWSFIHWCKVEATTRCRIMLWVLCLHIRILKNHTNRWAKFDEVPPDDWVWHKAFFLVDLGAGPWPRHARWPPKCLRLHQYSPKESRLRHQVINLTPPRRFEAWGDGPLRLEVLTIQHECQTVC